MADFVREALATWASKIHQKILQQQQQQKITRGLKLSNIKALSSQNSTFVSTNFAFLYRNCILSEVKWTLNFKTLNFLTLEFKLQFLFAISIQIWSKVSNWVFNLKGILNYFLKATQLCKVCKIKYRHSLASCACSQHTLWTKISLHVQLCKTKDTQKKNNGLLCQIYLTEWSAEK